MTRTFPRALETTRTATVAIHGALRAQQVMAAQRSMAALGEALVRLEVAVHDLRGKRKAAVAPPPAHIEVRLIRVESLAVPVRELRQARRPHAEMQQEVMGSKTLLLEIIRRAAYDWVLYRTSSRLLNKKLAEESFIWLFQEEPGHKDWDERKASGKEMTGFVSICSALDLDVEDVRSHIRQMTSNNVMSVGRPAEYRRVELRPSAKRARPSLRE